MQKLRLKYYQQILIRLEKDKMYPRKGWVQPHYLVEEGPPDLVERASTWLPCMYEKNTYRSHRKDGCLQTILPECAMPVKRAKRAGKYCQSWNEAATLQM